MSLLIGTFFKFCAYVVFGLIMEVKFSAISKIADGDITKEDKKMRGYVPLWMIPVYGILLTFVFSPVYFLLLQNQHFIVRYISWAITFTLFEALSGFLYDKLLNVKVWDYSNDKTSILNGYTKLSFIPLWGIAGLIIEQYVLFITFLTPYAIAYFLNFPL